MCPRIWSLVLSCGLALGLSCAPAASETGPAAERIRVLRDLAETRGYSLGRPVSAQPTPDGSAVIFLRGGARDPVLRLYELDLKTRGVAKLLAPEELLQGEEEGLSVEEKARRERMRVTLRGFTSFEVSGDGQKVLLSLSGRLYVLRRTDRQVTSLPAGPEEWIDPGFSPDSRFVAAASGGELHVIDIASGKAWPVTTGATDTLTHGEAEFVAMEEMDRDRGYWWSPDSSRLVFQETDVSGVETLHIADPLHPEAPPIGFRFPRAGRANARVRLGIVARSGGAVTWVKWDSERYPYLARVGWREGSPLTLLVQTRDQQEEKVLTVDPATGACREILTERDPAWINLHGEAPYWLDDGNGFLWLTETRGAWQLELREKTGGLGKVLTNLGFNINEIYDIDSKTRIAVVGGGPDPREQQLYRISFKGGAPVRITDGAGRHSARFSTNHKVYVHSSSLLDGRAAAVVRSADGKLLAELPSVAEPPPFLPNMEMTRVGAERQLDAVVIRPRDFEPGRRYPVILDVYGGPGYKVVRAEAREYLLHQWKADHGCIVVSLDGRGTPGYGRAWERAIRGNLLDAPLDDQVQGLRALAERYPEMDLGRVGVTGWSFGGTFTAMAVLKRPDVFRCGIAGAPGTDWLDYDTHYTERYLGLPSENPDAYRNSSPLTWASRLERPLLLIHGLTDDNVYFLHTLKLCQALFDAGKPFDLLPLTGTHLVADPDVEIRINTRMMDFFNEHLGLPVPYSGPTDPPGSQR